MSKRSERKEEHLALAQMFFDKEKNNSFDQMHLLRPALPESKVDLNSIKTNLFGKSIAAPFYINAMTGGSKKSYEINKNLGRIAAKAQIPMALGSASILVKEHEQLTSFEIAREENPDGIVMANVNPETPAEDVKMIVKELAADALQIHVNTVQEAAMPEGDRDFRWLDNMCSIREALDIPVIVKEVGFGFDESSLIKLKNNGFDLFDVAGQGGTNFAQIENGRNKSDISYLEDIGLPTVITSLIAKKNNVDFFVSGGVRNPLDILKGLCLGGKMVGIANTFLQKLSQDGSDGLEKMIADWKEELAVLLAVYGQSDLSNLDQIKRYYDLPLKSQIDQLF